MLRRLSESYGTMPAGTPTRRRNASCSSERGAAAGQAGGRDLLARCAQPRGGVLRSAMKDDSQPAPDGRSCGVREVAVQGDGARKQWSETMLALGVGHDLNVITGRAGAASRMSERPAQTGGRCVSAAPSSASRAGYSAKTGIKREEDDRKDDLVEMPPHERVGARCGPAW